MTMVQSVLTFGLTPDQNDVVKNCLPNRDYHLLIADESTDIIAIPATALIIDASVLDADEAGMIFEYYSEIQGGTDDYVLWLREPKPPKELQKALKCYDRFETVQDNLKYLLISAHSRKRKSTAFSNSIMIALKILSEIRKKPGITSLQLAERCDVSPRTVQRYIETLRCSGEWIEYDRERKGWQLFRNMSILFGDPWRDDDT